MTAGDDAHRTRLLVRTALWIAMCVALGYLMAGVPNIELISAAVFTCGALVDGGAARSSVPSPKRSTPDSTPTVWRHRRSTRHKSSAVR